MERQTIITSTQWQSIDTILLDMDGTLLDLAFDNYFWLDLIPKEYAKKHGVTENESHQFLRQLYQTHHGTLDWYCIDFWSEQMQLDIAAIKTRVAEKVEYRKGTPEFLQQAKAAGKKLYLVTNAHPDTLRIKLAQKDFSIYFDEILSSHDTGYPKEDDGFWQVIKMKWNFNPANTLFVDDSANILETAQNFGIGYLVGVNYPDSTKAANHFKAFAAVNELTELLV